MQTINLGMLCKAFLTPFFCFKIILFLLNNLLLCVEKVHPETLKRGVPDGKEVLELKPQHSDNQTGAQASIPSEACCKQLWQTNKWADANRTEEATRVGSDCAGSRDLSCRVFHHTQIQWNLFIVKPPSSLPPPTNFTLIRGM